MNLKKISLKYQIKHETPNSTLKTHQSEKFTMSRTKSTQIFKATTQIYSKSHQT